MATTVFEDFRARGVVVVGGGDCAPSAGRAARLSRAAAASSCVVSEDVDDTRRIREDLRVLALGVLSICDSECGSRSELLSCFSALAYARRELLVDRAQADYHPISDTWRCAKAVYAGETWAFAHMKSMEWCRQYARTRDAKTRAAVEEQLLAMIPTSCGAARFTHICKMAEASQEATAALLSKFRAISPAERRVLSARGDLDPMFADGEEPTRASRLAERLRRELKQLSLCASRHEPIADAVDRGFSLDRLLAIAVHFSNRNSTRVVRSIVEYLHRNDRCVDASAIVANMQKELLEQQDGLGMFAHISLFHICDRLGVAIDDAFAEAKVDAGVWRMMEEIATRARRDAQERADEALARSMCARPARPAPPTPDAVEVIRCDSDSDSDAEDVVVID
jgi:hypothetical protein